MRKSESAKSINKLIVFFVVFVILISAYSAKAYDFTIEYFEPLDLIDKTIVGWSFNGDYENTPYTICKFYNDNGKVIKIKKVYIRDAAGEFGLSVRAEEITEYECNL